MSNQSQSQTSAVGLSIVPHSPTIPVASVLLVITYFSIGLRFWTRVRIVRRVGWDDITIVLTLILYTFFAGSIFKVAHLVREPKFKNLDFSSIVNSVLWLLVAELLYIATVTALKISLGIFLLRITVKRWQQYTIHAAMAISTLFGVAFFFFAIFQCGSFKDGHTFMIRKVSGRCLSKRIVLGMSYAHAGIVAATDLLFALLPIALLKDVEIKRKEKIVVGLILSFGAFGGICSLIRLKYVPALAATNTLKFFGDSEGLAVWSLLEPGIGITTGCIATTRPLFRSLFRTPQDPNTETAATAATATTAVEKAHQGPNQKAVNVVKIASERHEDTETCKQMAFEHDLEMGIITIPPKDFDTSSASEYCQLWVGEDGFRRPGSIRTISTHGKKENPKT